MVSDFTLTDKDCFFQMVDSLKKCRRADLSDIAEDDDSIIEKLYVDPLPNDLVLRNTLVSTTTILIGRKGTGKSTIIARLQHEIRKKDDLLSIYLDVKTIYDQSKSHQIDRKNYGDILSDEEISKYLLLKHFLREVIFQIKEEVKTNTMKFYFLKIKTMFGRTKPFEDQLDQILEKIDSNQYEDISLIKERQTSNSKNKIGTSSHTTTYAIKADLSLDSHIQGGAEKQKVNERTSEDRVETKFSEILIQHYKPHTILTDIKQLLQKIGIRYVFICLDDFSEIDKDAMEIFVNTIVAPLNNWSDEFFKFKIAGYPGRVYLGDMDPTKIDQIKLDYYDLYTSNTATSVQNEAIDNVKRLLTQRCAYFCGKAPEYFFDTSKDAIVSYYKCLFDISSNVPRNVGWALWYAKNSISKDRKITIRDLELAAEQYYVNSIEIFFSQKYMKDSFNEKLERYHLNEMLNRIIAAAKKNKTEIQTSDSKIFSSDKTRPPTSHFYVEKELEPLLNTLELNFFITKYNEQKDKDGKLMVFFFLNYGLCMKEDIIFGRGSDHKYIVQRRFNYSDILKGYINSAKVIRCSFCKSSYPIQEQAKLELYDMLCPKCRKSKCEIVTVEVDLLESNLDIKLNEFDFKILNSLRIEEPQFASLLAQELDCNYQKISKRAAYLEGFAGGLIRKSKEKLDEKYGIRTYYYLTDISKELFFDGKQ